MITSDKCKGWYTSLAVGHFDGVGRSAVTLQVFDSKSGDFLRDMDLAFEGEDYD